MQIPSSYKVLREAPVPNLRGTFYDLEHLKSGARHVHLACDVRDSWFCIVLRTPPDDSTGLPHIMEHSGGQGSRRFPPGGGGLLYTHSLLTGANASTSADSTSYYCASPDHKDLTKFLTYITDIVFFPDLKFDTFLRQRGRLEFKKPEDPKSGLTYTGVIFNEMKATFGSPGTHASHALSRSLFPGHPYAENSGGDPAFIPDLSYERYLDFHRRHFHPSNACFLSYGSMPLDQILGSVEPLGLVEFERREPSAIPPVRKLEAPVNVEAPYPVTEADADKSPEQFLLGWVTVPVTDTYSYLKLQVLSEALVQGPSSPIRKALNSSGVVSGVIRGALSSYQKGLFALSLTGVERGSASQIEKIVFDTLQNVVSTGLESALVDAALTRLEFNMREPASGWQNFLRSVIPQFLHGGDPWDAVNFEPLLERLQQERRSGRPMEDSVQEHLIDNTHRARVSLVPDSQLEERTRKQEEARIAPIEVLLTDGIRDAIVEDSKRLSAATPPPDPATVPGALGKLEVSAEFPEPEGEEGKIASIRAEVFAQPTNGIAYVDVRFDAAGLPDDLQDYLGIFSGCLTRMGKMPERIEQGSGGVDVRNVLQTDVTGRLCLQSLEIGGRALKRQHADLAQILGDLLTTTEFEPGPVLEMIGQRASAMGQSIMGQAQRHLLRLAGGKLRRSLQIEDRIQGLTQLSFLKELAEKSESAVGGVIEKLEQIRTYLFNSGRMAVCVTATEEDLASIEGVLGEAIVRVPGGESSPPVEDLLPPAEVVHEARIAPLPVSFNCEVFTVAGASDPTTPAAAVLAQLMRFGHLNREIQRKGAAYGVDTELEPDRGVLWISSRRDPRIVETYAAIEEAIKQVAKGMHTKDEVEGAILPAFRPTLPPDSPADAARIAWRGRFTGYDLKARILFRQGVLESGEGDLQDAAERLVDGARATVGGKSQIEEASHLFDRIAGV